MRSPRPTTGSTTTVPATRRDRLRAETVAEILERSWALMQLSGTDALSLREVARQMGMAPSALYRYFAGRNDLLTALIVDGFTSLASTIRAERGRLARDEPDLPAIEVFVRVCRAYRQWSLSHRTQWALLFSTSIPDYNGTDETTAASTGATDVLTQIMADAVAEGAIDLDRLDPLVDVSMRPGLQEWSDNGGLGLPVAALAAALWCYATLHGSIALELNEHLPPALLDNEALFESSLRAVLEQITVR